MDTLKTVNWSEVFRKAAAEFIHKMALVEFLETKLSRSEFTEEDAQRLGESAKQERLKRLKQQGIV
ncbi:MAG: hypothetical protein Q7S74_06345 [Nanoarchaeota archaeon]|nr:hypothetical protein [Nanoarchaeota archaeon]